MASIRMTNCFSAIPRVEPLGHSVPEPVATRTSRRRPEAGFMLLALMSAPAIAAVPLFSVKRDS